jgi:hypothetical protein
MPPEHDVNMECAKAHQRYEDQILNLEEANLNIMSDIKEIRTKVDKVDENVTGLKVWILTSAVAGLLVLLGEAIYFGGMFQKIENDGNRISQLEEMHPRASR